MLLGNDLYALILAYIVNNSDTVESLLAILPADTEKCLPIALRHAFSTHHLMKHELLSYLSLLWAVPNEFNYQSAENVYLKSCNKGLVYLVPWILTFIVGDGRKRTLQLGLSLAASNGRTNIIKLLVSDYHVNVNHNSGDALLNAALNGHTETVTFLLQACANPTLRNHGTIVAAANAGKCDVVRMLLSHKMMKCKNVLSRCFVNAAMNGHVDVIKLLVNYGASLRGSANKMMIAACHRNQVKVIETLIELGAHSTIGDVLIHATLDNHVEVVRTLLRHGNRQYLHSPEYIITAIARQHKQIVQLFMHPDCDKHGNMIWPAIPRDFLLQDEIHAAIQHAAISHMPPI
jgi:hypothetical protein